jgi:hypothetical protein
MSVQPRFKKTLATAVLVAATTATVAMPNTSYALVGALTGTVPTLLVGAAIGVPFMGHLLVAKSNNEASVDAMFSILGLLIMDGRNGADFRFKQISSQEAEKCGITAAEANAYNSELDEINQVKQAVQADIASHSDASTEAQAEVSKAAWEKYSSYLSPEAYQAVRKIATKAVQSQ